MARAAPAAAPTARTHPGHHVPRVVPIAVDGDEHDAHEPADDDGDQIGEDERRAEDEGDLGPFRLAVEEREGEARHGVTGRRRLAATTGTVTSTTVVAALGPELTDEPIEVSATRRQS